ncbi:MAG: UDP-N-acetylmuramoyl-L-alanyl-D-glutamate--2,6-diaminopimelate ligase [Ignavibacteriae bacterium]|nr:UDP-N-acetylmuramoyl-L-alanyl-D-glutamate--2,6-diaminopimelate ligase [Ignavibacteriota bacterium]MCB9242552.1 UDP-N-acetylmuramoyl-L-alanyl-D-glutamate--2,6-diaminopimelate ligase [Ignavibacteriales bacterium]
MMKFSELSDKSSLKPVEIRDDFEVKGLAYDSRKVKEGYIFFAIIGYEDDGNKYIKDALANGAGAVITERIEGNEYAGELENGNRKKIHEAQDIRKVMAEMSREFYGNPAERIKVIGVTGTNGKTTITYLMKAVLEKAGSKTGLIGTISYDAGGEKMGSTLTTPDSIEIFGMLREMADNEMKYCVMEVSSIALELKRVYGLDFTAGIFTNLSSEHLDLHSNMENYFNAKKILFDGLRKESFAVSNADDEYGKAILDDTKAKKIFYSIDKESDYRAEDIKLGIDGLEFKAVTKEGEFKMKSGLTGRFNVSNMLAVMATANALRVDMEIIREAVADFRDVDGRFTRIKLPNGAYAVVDYSHTSDSLKNAVEAAREIVEEQGEGRVVTVFGCGGNRDRTKRPVMGKYATSLSDYSIITSDNPRFEEPMAIINEILSGVETEGNFEVDEDREEAIRKAIEYSKKGDLVLICGKGHETYQEVRGVKTHFDDKEMVAKYSNLAK